jgi:hypothetical protein
MGGRQSLSWILGRTSSRDDRGQRDFRKMPLAGGICVADGENQNWVDSRATLYRSAVEVAAGDSKPIIFS